MRKNNNSNFIIIGVVAALVLALGYAYYSKSMITEEIKKYVLENEKELESIAKEYISGNEVDLPKHIKKIEVYNDKNNTMVQFEYKKDGNKEYGFYYSSYNLVSAYQSRDVEFLELGGNKWMWQDGNMEGNVNKIKDLWYYYKVTKK